jgi:hypothetical protein
MFSSHFRLYARLFRCDALLTHAAAAAAARLNPCPHGSNTAQPVLAAQ